eukprot:9525442-Karenia_brevis.AAC.1
MPPGPGGKGAFVSPRDDEDSAAGYDDDFIDDAEKGDDDGMNTEVQLAIWASLMGAHRAQKWPGGPKAGAAGRT